MAVTFGAFTIFKFIQLNKALSPNVVTSDKEIDFNAINPFKPSAGISLHPIRSRSIVPYLKQIIKDELERIANDENLKHLIQK